MRFGLHVVIYHLGKKRIFHSVLLARFSWPRRLLFMTNEYSLETSFGEIDISSLTKEQWGDIKILRDHLMQCGEFTEEYKATIGAFIIFLSELEFMAKPRMRDENEH